MGFKKVSVYGFCMNEYVFMLPAIRYVLGEIKPSLVLALDDIRENRLDCDVFCVNCGMSFYDLELAFTFFDASFTGRQKPTVLCLSWEGVPQENLDIMEKYKADLIMFDLRGEEEFAFCRKAYHEGKPFRSEGTFARGEEFYCDRVDTYGTLSKNQKYAFMYMMTGRTQKELQVDFGYNSLNTAATHWRAVLTKFRVRSVFELRAKFR
ncbi:MAG: helix-turn-helix transcriptional regulator [Treponema sp.]|nr:helix-turn-helix transcriptional regulator [Treponema sp.]